MPPTKARRNAATTAPVKRQPRVTPQPPTPKKATETTKATKATKATNTTESTESTKSTKASKDVSPRKSASTGGAGIKKKRKRRLIIAGKAAKSKQATKAKRASKKGAADNGVEKTGVDGPEPTKVYNDELKTSGLEYKVEEIVDSKVEKGVRYYFVKWVGYPKSANTWEPEQHLRNSTDLIAEFDDKYPDKP